MGTLKSGGARQKKISGALRRTCAPIIRSDATAHDRRLNINVGLLIERKIALKVKVKIKMRFFHIASQVPHMALSSQREPAYSLGRIQARAHGLGL